MTISAPAIRADENSSIGTSARAASILAAVLGVSVLFAHRQALAVMVDMWQTSPMYSYGFTVPLISGYLLWQRWPALARLAPRPSVVSGVALLLVTVAMTTAARAGGIQILDQLALLVSIMAVVLLLFGYAHLKTAWAPLAYLLLMIPIWDGLTERLHAPFQLRSAEIGAWMLQTVGIPAFRQETVIALPNLTIEVARACSGVNYLIAVFSLGLPLAYLYLPGIWRRVLLLVSALAVAALSNGLRVALIGALAYLEIGSPLHGPFHVLHGLFVAGIGYVVLFAGLRVLTPQSDAAANRGAVAPIAPTAAADSRSRAPLAASLGWAVAAVVVFLIIGLNAFIPVLRAAPLPTDLRAFPRQLGSWSADVIAADAPSEFPWRGADAELRRRYVRGDGVAADLYLGYFASQTQGREVITHRATALHGRASTVNVTGEAGRAFDVNYVPAGRDGVSTLFWYEVDRQPQTNRFVVKGRTLLGAMARGETSAAVIVLTTTADRETAAAALRDLAPLVEAAFTAQLSSGHKVEE